jgi:large subunit ribosomal protein L1
MAFVPKKRKGVNGKVDASRQYTLKDASALVKEVNTTKFDASVDIHIRLGVDPKKSRSGHPGYSEPASWYR